MKRCEYGEVVNDPESFKEIAEEIKGGGQCVFGWTDENGTHYDLLLSTQPQYLGGGLQGGVSAYTDLFVSVMRVGAFGFEINDLWKSPGYVAEKLRMASDVSTEKLAELINGVISELYED